MMNLCANRKEVKNKKNISYLDIRDQISDFGLNQDRYLFTNSEGVKREIDGTIPFIPILLPPN